MVTLAPPQHTPADAETQADETPILLKRKLSGADRAFHALLATSGAIVLAVLVALIVFLFVHSWWALKTFKLGLLHRDGVVGPSPPGSARSTGGLSTRSRS